MPAWFTRWAQFLAALTDTFHKLDSESSGCRSLPLEVTDSPRGRLKGRGAPSQLRGQGRGQSRPIQGMGVRPLGSSLELAMTRESERFVCAHISEDWQSPLQTHYRIHNGNWGKFCSRAICCLLVTFGQYSLRKSRIGLILVIEEGN